MIRLALPLLLSLGQDPDRSTPERTVQGLLAVWARFRSEDRRRSLLATKAAQAGSECSTETRRAALRLRAESGGKSETPPPTCEVVKRLKRQDGTVAIDARCDGRRYRAIVEPAGREWLVYDLFEECDVCDGSGDCGKCLGKGRADGECPDCNGLGSCPSCEGKGEKCTACDESGSCRACHGLGRSVQRCPTCKGKKVCAECEGEGLLEDPLVLSGPLLLGEAGLAEVDLTSPAAAASSYLRLLTRDLVEESKTILARDEEVRRKFLPYLTPETREVVEGVARGVTTRALERFENARPRVETIEGQSAILRADVPVWGDGGSCRLILKQVDRKWLVDAVQRPCFGCEGTGKCSLCKGEGKFAGSECFSCKGAADCATCKGAQWLRE